MTVLFELKALLKGGRTIDGIYKNYVRTKSADGFSRLYEKVGDKFIFRRAAYTHTWAESGAGKGDKTICRRKITAFTEAEYPDKSICSDTIISREYDSLGKRKSVDFDQRIFSKNPSLIVRDGDVSNYTDASKIVGIYDEASTSVLKDYTGDILKNQYPRYQKADGTFMTGYATKGGVPITGESHFLDIDELKSYEQLM